MAKRELELEIRVGQIWKSRNERSSRFIRIETVTRYSAFIRTVVKRDGAWEAAPLSRKVSIALGRFPDKSDGFVLIEDVRNGQEGQDERADG